MEVFIVFGSIAAVIIYLASRRHNERMELIRKGLTTEELDIRTAPKHSSRALFCGLFAISIGLALLSGAFIQICGPDRGMITGSLFFIFSGISMLAYWKLSMNEQSQE